MPRRSAVLLAAALLLAPSPAAASDTRITILLPISSHGTNHITLKLVDTSPAPHPSSTPLRTAKWVKTWRRGKGMFIASFPLMGSGLLVTLFGTSLYVDGMKCRGASSDDDYDDFFGCLDGSREGLIMIGIGLADLVLGLVLLSAGVGLRRRALEMRQASPVPEVSLGLSPAGDGGGVSLRWTF